MENALLGTVRFFVFGPLRPVTGRTMKLPGGPGEAIPVQDRKLVHRALPVVRRFAPIGGDITQP